MWHAEREKGLSCGVDKSCHSCLISMGVDGCVGGWGWMGQSVVEVMSLQAAVAVATCNEWQLATSCKLNFYFYDLATTFQ